MFFNTSIGQGDVSTYRVLQTESFKLPIEPSFGQSNYPAWFELRSLTKSLLK